MAACRALLVWLPGGAVLIQDHDLLPDLSGCPCAEILDLTDRREGDGLVEILNVKCSNLGDQRHHLAAVVEVTHQLKVRHLDLWRGGRPWTASENALGILGELMHIHHVRERTKFMKCCK